MQTQTDLPISLQHRNLFQLVRIAADKSKLTAVQRNSFIINDVPRDFQIISDESILAAILNNLLSTVVSNTENSCIRIKATEYEDIISIYIRDNSSYSNYAVNANLEQAKILARKMNGSLTIRNMEEKFTTILLSFPNFPFMA